MTIREEFDKDFPYAPGYKDTALKGAKWAAKKLCDYQSQIRCAMETPQECKACLLVKELANE